MGTRSKGGSKLGLDWEQLAREHPDDEKLRELVSELHESKRKQQQWERSPKFLVLPPRRRKRR